MISSGLTQSAVPIYTIQSEHYLVISVFADVLSSQGLQISKWIHNHYCDVIMTAMASQITSLVIVYPTIYSGADQRKHQSTVSLAFVWGIHGWPVNSPHKWPVTFPFDDVIMISRFITKATGWLLSQPMLFAINTFLDFMARLWSTVAA